MSEREITSRVDGHIHMWSKRMKFTSSDIGTKSGMHRHKVDLKKGIAMPLIKGGHWHKLHGGENGKRKGKRKFRKGY